MESYRLETSAARNISNLETEYNGEQMPKDVWLSLQTMGKFPAGYKATVETGWILKQCGWALSKRGRGYCYLLPPEGQAVGKNIRVKVPAPTNDEIIAAANAMRLESTGTKPLVKSLNGWPIRYLPSHTITLTVQETDSLGLNGIDWRSPESEITSYEEEAICRVGFILIWQAEVRWNKNGEASITVYPQSEIPRPDLCLFDQSKEQSQLKPSNCRESLTINAFEEGSIKTVELDVFERSVEARRACISHYGAHCQVCAVDFVKRYGKIGEGYIHVHHLTPLSETREEQRVDPIMDLRPVCPNCHAMLHRAWPPLTVDDLRQQMALAAKFYSF